MVGTDVVAVVHFVLFRRPDRQIAADSTVLSAADYSTTQQGQQGQREVSTYHSTWKVSQ